ncbi:RNA polymerase sigma-70 factor [Chryseosolibacter indicus]|uniref:RNA polymerase sigma-70 factor n=1 Tax=Chryseosolibacter indicus TaxID=2782351 RepID=A0ABS5VK00_9BACT|nr:RNA polymerase sigma-70 factor [Chryseosolibacter indicus]MBT1701758.1 RNA polymerase sigma-70 factor [Chryseosolibacter indicus]
MSLHVSLARLQAHPSEVKFPGNTPVQNDMESLFNRVIGNSDYDAFQMLFLKMYSPLCQFCVKFVGVNEVAEELVSDVFYTIWKNRDRIIVASPKAYLFTAVRNRGYDYLRKVKRSEWCDLERASDVTDSKDSGDGLIEKELIEQIDCAVASLPKQCRLIFELSRDHGMKYKEIASMLNIGVKTVETQIGRALKHLRKTIPIN